MALSAASSNGLASTSKPRRIGQAASVLGQAVAADFSNTATGTYSSGGINYKYVTFTSSGTLTIGTTGIADILVVGGGASGSNWAGGGNGAVCSSTVYLTAGTYTATVGGAGSPSWLGQVMAITGAGGTGGGNITGNGGATSAGAAGISPFGGNGGTGIQGPDFNGNGGGGGGGGAAPANGGSAGYRGGGSGGAGISNSITGSAVTYGAGGGGASPNGGGGSGAGTANTGNGGGGNGGGASGGSGVVIVRVRTN